MQASVIALGCCRVSEGAGACMGVFGGGEGERCGEGRMHSQVTCHTDDHAVRALIKLSSSQRQLKFLAIQAGFSDLISYKLDSNKGCDLQEEQTTTINR